MTISFLQIVELFKASLGVSLLFWSATGDRDRQADRFWISWERAVRGMLPTPLAGGIVLISTVIVLMTALLWYRPCSTLFIARDRFYFWLIG
jgi:hypothetical protein